MDVRDRRSIVTGTPAITFAAGALLIELAIIVLPWNFGTSFLSSAWAEHLPFMVKTANLIAVLTYAMTISIGIGILRRSSGALAAGVFLGLAIVIGLREISNLLGLIRGGGWFWQTVVVNALIVGECLLLLLAARAARDEELTTS